MPQLCHFNPQRCGFKPQRSKLHKKHQNFAGAWVPLTGIGSNNDQLSTIGDKGDQDFGRFNISSAFITGSSVYGNDLPSSSIPLSIRFYDSLSPSSSIYFNAISNTSGAWNWVIPSDPQAVITLSLSDAGILWQGGSGSAYKTTINVVPEPSAMALLLVGGFLIYHLKRRRI